MSLNDALNRSLSDPLVRWVLVLLAGNILSGIAAGLYTRNLHLAEIADWLMTRALPYLLGAVTVQLVVMFALPEYEAAIQLSSTAVWGFVLLALVGKILDNLRALGIPIPAALGDSPRKSNTTATP